MTASIFDGLPDLFTGCLGEAVTYTPAGGSPVAINVIIAVTPAMVGIEEASTTDVRVELYARTEDVPDLAEGDSVVGELIKGLGSKSYLVVEPILPDGKGMMSFMAAHS